MQQHLVLKPSSNLSGTVSNTSTALSSFGTIPNDAVGAIITVETSDLRFTWDGSTDPAGGFPMVKNSVWEVIGRDLLTSMRMYAASDAFVSAALYKAE